MPSFPPALASFLNNPKAQYAVSAAGGTTAGAVIGGLIGGAIGASVSLGIGTGLGVAIGAAIGGASGGTMAAGSLFIGKKVMQHLQSKHPVKDLASPKDSNAPGKPLKQRQSNPLKQAGQKISDTKKKAKKEVQRRFQNDMQNATTLIESHIEDIMNKPNQKT